MCIYYSAPAAIDFIRTINIGLLFPTFWRVSQLSVHAMMFLLAAAACDWSLFLLFGRFTPQTTVVIGYLWPVHRSYYLP